MWLSVQFVFFIDDITYALLSIWAECRHHYTIWCWLSVKKSGYEPKISICRADPADALNHNMLVWKWTSRLDSHISSAVCLLSPCFEAFCSSVSAWIPAINHDDRISFFFRILIIGKELTEQWQQILLFLGDLLLSPTRSIVRKFAFWRNFSGNWWNYSSIAMLWPFDARIELTQNRRLMNAERSFENIKNWLIFM